MTTSNILKKNPLEMNYAGLTEWVETYMKNERDLGHVLLKPSPILLTTIYAKLVIQGEIIANKWVKLACERHLKDLKRSKEDSNFPWEFDEEKGWRPIRFIEKKCHPTKGNFKHLVMQPWQHFVVGSMFGWVNKETGVRRYRESLIFVARKNGKTRVTAVTKANIIKTTDGKFLEVFYNIAKEYPNIKADDWYIDIMTAKLIDENRRKEFQVMVLPNLYGDIITDEAAEFQGGVGTAGSSNIGHKYAMFEAIHGSAPRMVQEGRAQYADPCSIMRAVVLLLSHIGCQAEAQKLEKALDICTITERKVYTTGRADGATNEELTNYIIETMQKL